MIGNLRDYTSIKIMFSDSEPPASIYRSKISPGEQGEAYGTLKYGHTDICLRDFRDPAIIHNINRQTYAYAQ